MTGEGLDRFLQAQEPVFDQVLAELETGWKQSHWMWFIFPQLRALGRSETAKFYGLADLTEAEAYLAHPVLGQRLVTCTDLMLAARPKSALAILGKPDDMKFRSCTTLFSRVKNAPEVFSRALEEFYDGPDQVTLDLLNAG